MVFALTSCQTPLKVSSSETSELLAGVATDERAEICEALQPSQISPAAFDASPPEARTKMAADTAAWQEVCT